MMWDLHGSVPSGIQSAPFSPVPPPTPPPHRHHHKHHHRSHSRESARATPVYSNELSPEHGRDAGHRHRHRSHSHSSTGPNPTAPIPVMLTPRMQLPSYFDESAMQRHQDNQGPYETANRALFFPTPVVHQHQHQHHTHVHTHSKHSHTKHSHSHHPQVAVVNASHGISLPQALVYHRPHLPAPAMNNSAPAYRLHYSETPLPAMHPNFQYSKCTGRKKALCVGVNYLGQRSELRGCINDAKSVRKFLIKHHNYSSSDIVLLTDDASDPRQRPTRRNILEAMRWLVRSAQGNDSLFFHYSGHGGQTPDLDGDELDGYDEVIYPVDYQTEGHIVDDEMHKIMVKPLPAGCRLTALFDSCHSGTVLDLPYIYSSHGRLKGSHVKNSARARKATPADVISWSGCQDDQTSADTFAGGVAVGAMSYAFTTALLNNPKQSYQDLLKSIRSILYPKYSQKPQLGSSHHIDTNLQFII